MKIYQNSKFKREGNTVTCTIECRYVPYLCGKPMECNAIEFSVTDHATCHPKDEFNERTGQILAETRASVRVYKKVKQLLSERGKNACLEIDEVNDDLLRIEYLIDDTLNHQNKLKEENAD